MLGMKEYPQQYIDTCRARVATDLAAWKKAKAPAALESRFCNNLLLVHDYLFVHRLRTVEGKDGNPLNEVRVLCNSMLHNDNVVTFRRPPSEPGNAETGLRYDPADSVLGLKEGDPIALSAADLARLSKAFFAEIERRYT